MSKKEFKETNRMICPRCLGRGKKSRRLRKKVRQSYQSAYEQYVKVGEVSDPPTRPKGQLYVCQDCHGTGLILSSGPVSADYNKYPHVAIVGGGIGGTALAAACLHRGIPFSLYERDLHFSSRAQGYGLTLQQASKAIEGLGVTIADMGVISTRHIVHTPEGKVVGQWGGACRGGESTKDYTKRSNVHIARQSLRSALLKEIGGEGAIFWGHRLVDIIEDNGGVELSFLVDGEVKKTRADLVVGADGIRSSVRQLVLGETIKPLRYLGCIVILGICPLLAVADLQSTLLDSATVFQTANGHERIFMMPYTAHEIMWQLSFPMTEEAAKQLSAGGAVALKEEAVKRTPWHLPIPQIIAATTEEQISGYPVYDRDLLADELFNEDQAVTLIGDAAHPMSPFKGQGANQALLDALALARAIFSGCQTDEWKTVGIRDLVLTEFESEMIKRSASKVQGSADAARFLHSEVALEKCDRPRGQSLKTK
ncbi:NAD(P)/FAD-dependent oxidoreductase [Sphingobacterium sp. UT-1RO-CII-1]|uniref:FAD-dependent oxidoreductase n=1 Tax=Sphingobacterium sp. UT-1RO-CII-1 TaxID=2995225 RepID=UPI00227B3034|nr:NAD(P)/FAD-dependent oxidoreductase [Sphingobacterium sp. UT-1RO-CII-1]MCY4779398.1 NAD(P)/FAD-dependent oxidoreductase [Sphingobacterium sp. UT-1RO-CII-1]